MSSVLTKEILEQHLQKYAYVRFKFSKFLKEFFIFSMVVGLVLSIVVGLVLSISISNLVLSVVLIFSIALIRWLIGIIIQDRKGNHLRYWLVRDTLSGKDCYLRITYGENESDTYYLYLENYGVFRLYSDQPSLCLRNDSRSSLSYYLICLYERTVPGDTYFLVYTADDSSKAVTIIPAADWELSPNDFIESDGEIYPTKCD